MISRIRKSFTLAAGDQRAAARMALGVVAVVLCLMLVLTGASLGGTTAFLAAQPSPSGSASGSPGPPASTVFLLNPNVAYDPGAAIREPAVVSDDPPPDVPKVSDKFDGVDTAYHIVAGVSDVLPGSIVEAYYKQDDDAVPEITIGELSPVPGFPNTYELFWDIPDSLAVDFGFITVRLYQQTPSGFEEVSAHTQEVRLQHKQSGTGSGPGASETVEIVWPSQGGPLGFFKSSVAGSSWVTRVNGLASAAAPGPSQTNPTQRATLGASRIRLYYTRSKPGVDPVYVPCNGAGSNTSAGPAGSGLRTFASNCTLAGTHRPSQVTAIAAVALEDQSRTQQAYSQESADVHMITPYLQQVEDMKLTLTSNITTNDPDRRNAVPDAEVCLTYEVKVVDELDRPVQGANVDVHVRGPGDAVEFGTDTNTNASSNSSAKQAPDKAHSSTEASRDCEDTTLLAGTHSDHNIPGAADIKHLESISGTGLSGGGTAGAGEWMFHLYSPNVGDTEITAWVDEEPVANDEAKREADDDLPEQNEASDTNFAQWLPEAPAVSIDPAGATAAAGNCQRFVVRVRGGTRAVRGANVDVHATGPTDGLDFCDPSDASPRRAPVGGTGHNAEDNGEVTHAGQPPVAQHTEGETNNEGNFIIGIMSPDPGDTTLTAWYDAAEEGFDNDTQDAGEATGSATTNWLTSTGDAAVSFLNPSPYGEAGTNVAKTQDVDAAYHIVTRVSSIEPIAGLEIFYQSGSDPLVKIGDAARVGQTDAYEVFWAVDVPDGDYTLIARIRDTSIVAEQDIAVLNEADPLDPTSEPFQTVEITAPKDGERASFVRGRLSVTGVASAGADGVTLYYTKEGPLTTPTADDWIECGTASLASGSAPQQFTLDCSLQGADQPSMVTGVAALPYNCLDPDCALLTNDSGDAHRIFGGEADPILSIEPAETAANTGTCQKFVITLQDQTRQPIPGQNLDAHLTGPGNSGNFCAPTDGTGTPRRAPDGGAHIADGNETDEGYHDEGGVRTHHTEGETTGDGRMVLGIESETSGDAQLTVWLDANDDDQQGQEETNDVSLMHWETDPVCDITGTDGNDTLTGSDASETICGFGGDDTITGGGGNDVIGGGAGNDTMRGSAGNDRVRGGVGADKSFGGGGADRLNGGGGNDVVNGHRGNDRLRGNGGADRLNGGPGRDDCLGGSGRDRLRKCERGSRSVAQGGRTGSFAARTRPI